MIDDMQFDMLVDGELSNSERREVLTRLEREPDGWRRCALAFLEAQSWREGMRGIAGQTAARPIESQPVGLKPRVERTWLRTALAMAACFLVALGLGLAVDDLLSRDGSPVGSTPLAEMAPSEEPRQRQPFDPRTPPPSPEAAAPLQYVSIPARDPVSGEANMVRLPIVPRESLGEDWLERLPSALPDHVVQSLQNQGHDVLQHRRLVPYRAEDGREVVFPVDEVELVPVSNRGYQ